MDCGGSCGRCAWGVSPAERQALLDLYTSLGGPGWKPGSLAPVVGWHTVTNTTNDPCLPAPWTGVTCASNPNRIVYVLRSPGKCAVCFESPPPHPQLACWRPHRACWRLMLHRVVCVRRLCCQVFGSDCDELGWDPALTGRPHRTNVRLPLLTRTVSLASLWATCAAAHSPVTHSLQVPTYSTKHARDRLLSCRHQPIDEPGVGGGDLS